mgnify:CR=1 FL=1
MFSAKSSVNQLAALLVAYEVRHVVVCPGSRNAPLVNDFYELSLRGDLCLWPVTDERSAAFVAIGLYLGTRRAAAVCVTSGTALLNTLPAVAEAYYRHAPLLIISADRPPCDINQLKGQTIPQQGALMPYTPTWQIPEAAGDVGERICREALQALHGNGGQPVHINVPLSEPLHIYNKEELPFATIFHEPQPMPVNSLPAETLQMFAQAELPAVFVGQMDFPPSQLLGELFAENKLLILSEAIGSTYTLALNAYRAATFSPPTLLPDVVLHIGGTAIEKDYASWLFRGDTRVVRIEPTAAEPDTFGQLYQVVHCLPENALKQLRALPSNANVECINQTILSAKKTKSVSSPWTSLFSELLRRADATQRPVCWHVGNSTPLRLCQTINGHYFHCNRGVNGIEGSLSVAAGHSLVESGLVCCVVGDLSFFYDSNALWNSNLRGNLRVMVLNDGGGGIFQRLKGLNASTALPLVAAVHTTSAKGICHSYKAEYIGTSVHDRKALAEALEAFFAPSVSCERPLVVEVCLD